jgi:hypothetical protein
MVRLYLYQNPLAAANVSISLAAVVVSVVAVSITCFSAMLLVHPFSG